MTEKIYLFRVAFSSMKICCLGIVMFYSCRETVSEMQLRSLIFIFTVLFHFLGLRTSNGAATHRKKRVDVQDDSYEDMDLRRISVFYHTLHFGAIISSHNLYPH